MCYMNDPETVSDRVGVRELRQNLSVYLRRVKRGETLEVTERGVTVAELRPLPKKRLSILDRMIADGRATPANRSHKLLAPPPRIPGRPLSEILQEMRDEDDR